MNTTSWTIEILPNHTDKIIDAISDRKWSNLPKSVFITHIEGNAYSTVSDSCRTLIERGIHVVPHIAVRNISQEESLQAIVTELCDMGISEVLLLGGGAKKPKGKYTEVMDALCSGYFDNVFKRINFAGFPEMHPDVKNEDKMLEALTNKVAWCKQCQVEANIITQLCFDENSIATYLSTLQKRRIDASVSLGLSAPVSMTKLIKFALICGVGNSVKFLEKNASGATGLIKSMMGQYNPKTLMETFPSVGDQSIDRYHFYAFGNYQGAFETSQ